MVFQTLSEICRGVFPAPRRLGGCRRLVGLYGLAMGRIIHSLAENNFAP
jgi:hypothetical protein